MHIVSNTIRTCSASSTPPTSSEWLSGKASLSCWWPARQKCAEHVRQGGSAINPGRQAHQQQIFLNRVLTILDNREYSSLLPPNLEPVCCSNSPRRLLICNASNMSEQHAGTLRLLSKCKVGNNKPNSPYLPRWGQRPLPLQHLLRHLQSAYVQASESVGCRELS